MKLKFWRLEQCSIIAVIIKIAYCSLGCLNYRGLPVTPEVAVQISYSLSILWKLSDPSSGLTYPTLKGARKQSVVDAECLFNPDLTALMRQKGFENEARYTEIIWNWRRSCDARGLSELHWCRFNYQFLNLILEDLMPWYKQQYDFSLLEVNRYVCVLSATIRNLSHM